MSVHLLAEIARLKKLILGLSAVVEGNLSQAMVAVARLDVALARRVIDRDNEVDRTEVDVEEECLKILALYQPVAIDLRFLVAVMKINNDLERIGDAAVNIAEQVQFMGPGARPDPSFDFTIMAQKAQLMVKNSLDALINLDTALAHQVCAADDEIDAMYREMIVKFKDAVRADSSRLDESITRLMVSRHLERIADHATNIAEDVIYMVNGQIVRHQPEQGK